MGNNDRSGIEFLRDEKDSISQNTDTELLELRETMVLRECRALMMLNLLLSLFEVEAYKEDSTKIVDVYEAGKEPSNCYFVVHCVIFFLKPDVT